MPFVPFYAPKRVKEQEPFDGRAIDYSHEREWRVLDDFRFEYKEIQFVVLEKIEDLDSIPESIVNEIGKDNFLFINIYKRIEELWPTHIID